jgi:hypothetical protein
MEDQTMSMTPRPPKGKPPLQLDLLSLSGLKQTRPTRTVIGEIDRLAKFYDSQGHRDAVISLSSQQAKKLAQTLKVHSNPLAWRGHPVRIVSDR